ncbi:MULTISPECIES: GNAT family N-acetyltransferase [Paenibacillus]|uniref:GNAT family N-acetyltransferase n=1 Tax=Paenibacillus TaxID=44249 RepID=UPI0022B8CE1D|nr:GNAT family N-acetyltransferase [Paenibacillus caseinilyticus]MCZ8521063.1 GNAT family N-acetyltransferase [Paenibacillus caseinilyticus]
MIYTHRLAVAEDYEKLCAFPQNKVEQFYMYPRWSYPVSAAEMREVAAGRMAPTVLLRGGEAAAYGNLYYAAGEEGVWIGNVIVSPLHRGQGAGTALIRTLMEKARSELGAGEVQLMCHSTNTAALLLYRKLGFKPYEWAEKTGPYGDPVLLLKLKQSL